MRRRGGVQAVPEKLGAGVAGAGDAGIADVRQSIVGGVGGHVGEQAVDIEQGDAVEARQAVEQGPPEGAGDAGQQAGARRAKAQPQGRQAQVGRVPHHELAGAFGLQLPEHGQHVGYVVRSTCCDGGGDVGPTQHLQGNVAHIVAATGNHVERVRGGAAGAGNETVHLVTQGRHIVHAACIGAPVGETGAARQGRQQGAGAQLLRKHLRPHRPVAVALRAVCIDRREAVAANGRVRRDPGAEDQGQGNGVVAHVGKAVAEYIKLGVGRRSGRAGRQAKAEDRVPEKAGDVHRCLLLGWEDAFARGRICSLADQEAKAEDGVWSSNVKAAHSGGDLWLYINGTSDRGRVCSM